VLLQVLRLLKVPFMMMSATVPESARELYGIVDKIVENREEHSEAENIAPIRTLRKAGPAEKPKDVEAVLSEMVAAGRGIVYANTVERALKYYRWFEKQGINPILYHSLFTEPDKKRIESELLDALGREAWEEEKARGIAVLTQRYVSITMRHFVCEFSVPDQAPRSDLASG
jgi:CRISPR-associated endonuclease/helicase Cas3